MAGTTSFSHLVSPTRAGAARAENETDDERKDREDAERKANKKATGKAETDDERETREDDEREANKKATGKAETDDERAAREDDEKSAKRGQRAEGDDDEEGDDDSDKEDMRDSGKGGKAYRRGIARCTAIFANPAAGRNPALAAQLAFDSELTRGQAIRALQVAPAGARAERSGRNPQLGAGGSSEVTGRAAVASSWDRAFAQNGIPVKSIGR